jgi:TetR/AcrR family transcriptional regulator, mexJK operon transcriptional repressor
MAAHHRARVLRAATRCFLAHGYRSSVEDIARRAGVAKQTVYHHFASKDELFKEVARGLAKRVLIELAAEPEDLRAGLTRFALAYRRRVLGAQGIAMFRTLLPEIQRFPTLARAVYQGSAGETVRRLAQYLRKAMDTGGLRRDEPVFAAELLLGMLAGHDRIKRLYGLACSDETDAARTARIVESFLRIYDAGLNR